MDIYPDIDVSWYVTEFLETTSNNKIERTEFGDTFVDRDMRDMDR